MPAATNFNVPAILPVEGGKNTTAPPDRIFARQNLPAARVWDALRLSTTFAGFTAILPVSGGRKAEPPTAPPDMIFARQHLPAAQGLNCSAVSCHFCWFSCHSTSGGQQHSRNGTAAILALCPPAAARRRQTAMRQICGQYSTKSAASAFRKTSRAVHETSPAPKCADTMKFYSKRDAFT